MSVFIRKYFILIAAFTLLFAVSVYADSETEAAARLFEGAVLIESDYLPPISAALDTSPLYGERIAREIEAYEDNGGEYYLFLPSSAVLQSVKLVYTGDAQLYDEDNGALLPTGSVFFRDLSGGSFRFYEYDKAGNVFIIHNVTVMKGENNAAVYIDLNDGDAALKRINSSHWDVETGRIIVSDCGGELIYNGELTRMKGHGLTSYDGSGRLNTKNSYNINIGDKTELIEGAGRSKKYSMLRIRTNGSYDATGISYPLGFYIYNALVGPDYFNIECRYVDLYINGEYRGVYILTERMDINGSMELTDLEEKTVAESPKFSKVSQSRKKSDPAIKAGIQGYSYCNNSTLTEADTDITGGYVLEIMCNTYGEAGFLTREGMFINVKSPECPTKEQVQYIACYVQEFEDALFSDTGYNSLGKHYTEYCDLRSYAAQTIAYSFCLNWEIFRTSTYIHKDADGQPHSVLTFGPAWDFETGPDVMSNDKTLFGQSFAYTERQQYIWFQQLWRKGAFMSYISSVNDSFKGITDILLGNEAGTRIFSLAEYANSIQASQLMNWIRWKQPSTYESKASSMRKSVGVRNDHWFGELWNDAKYLTGVDVSSKDNGDGSYTLTCTARGKAESCQWYKANDSLDGGTMIAGAVGYTYTAGEGVYYCAVKGQNNAYWANAYGSIFNNSVITMYSDPISTSGNALTNMPAAYTLADEPEKAEKAPAETELYADDYNDYINSVNEAASPLTPAADVAEIVQETPSYSGYIVFMAVCMAASFTAALVFGYLRLGGKKNA